MFGLKIVKKEDYSVLEYQLEKAQALLDERECDIKTLNSRIQELENELKLALKKIADAEPKKEPNTILLSDVAETPLTEEKPKRQRRVTKKAEGVKTPRKKAASKTEE